MRLNYPYGAKLTPWNAGGAMTVRGSPSRDDLDDSMDFLLPSSLAKGSPSLFFRIFPPAGISSAIDEVLHTTQVTFMKAVPVNVYLVGVSCERGGTLRTVRSGAANDIRSHLGSIMPVPSVNDPVHVFGVKYLDSADDFCNGDGFDEVNRAPAKFRGLTKNATNSTLS